MDNHLRKNQVSGNRLNEIIVSAVSVLEEEKTRNRCEFERDLKKKHDEIENLLQQNEVIQNILVQFQNKKDELKKLIEHYSISDEQHDDMILTRKFTQINQNKMKNLTNQLQEFKALQGRLEELKQKYQKDHLNFTALKKKYEELQHIANSKVLSEQNNELQTEIIKLKEDKMKYKTEVVKANSHIQELSNQVHNLKEEKVELENMLKRMKEGLNLRRNKDADRQMNEADELIIEMQHHSNSPRPLSSGAEDLQTTKLFLECKRCSAYCRQVGVLEEVVRDLLDYKLNIQIEMESIKEDLEQRKLLVKELRDTLNNQQCRHFLQPQITPQVKNVLVPFLQAKRTFPYNDFVRYLSDQNGDCRDFINLLYCMLALEPRDYNQSKDSIRILSVLTKDLHTMGPSIIDLTEDSDVEEMEVADDSVSLLDFLNLFNNSERVKKILNYFNEHCDDVDVLNSLTQLCHNLLLIYKDSIQKFKLVYMLALKGTFLNKLWFSIKRYESLILHSSGDSFSAWKDCQTSVSVLCDMFTFYTETLTDFDSTDTSGTFTTTELIAMSELLMKVALNMIDFAFPMCRFHTFKSSIEITHLYYSSLSAVKKLHMLDVLKGFCEVDFWTKKKIHVSQDLARKNYLSRTIRPFYGLVVDDDDDEHLPPLSTIEQRSLAILQELPFLLEFNQRVLTLRQLCYYNFGNSQARYSNEFFNDNVITVRRAYLYEDAFDKLSHRNESDLRHKLRIQFINNAGLEEAGIDGGGIFKEFINEVLKTAFDPNRGFFLLTADNMLYPNPNVHLILENYTDHYYFIGRLVGKAIFENILVDLPLAEFFLAKLLVHRASAHYLESLDPVLYRNLLYLRDYNGDVQELGLNFTLVNNDLGETQVFELKQDGANIPVTNYNRLEYIHRLADLKLNTQIKKQCHAFREGLDSVVPLLWLKLFNHLEMQVIIAGDTQEMDIEDLRLHTLYGGEFTADHTTIELFWKILRGFTDTEKKMLLKFVTSYSRRPPLLGFKELNPAFCIQSSGSVDRMPTASTCLNLLKLPVIMKEEMLRQKLLLAIEQQAGFELS